MKVNMDIINQSPAAKNIIYVILTAAFLFLSVIAIFLSFQIKSLEKKPVSPLVSNQAPTSAIPTPASASAAKLVNGKYIDPEFVAQNVADMKLVKTTFEKGNKFTFSNKDVTFEIYIGTGWMRDDPSRNFNNKDTTINFLPAYNFTDNFSYLGFDFIGKKTQKYVTIKCTYDSNSPLLLSRCQDLLGSFYLIGE